MPTGLVIRDIIAITGHRDYPDPGSLYKGLDRLQAKEYVFGGARGTDSDALKYLSRTQPAAVKTVVVPNRLIDQPFETRAITRRHANNIIELRNSGPDRYRIRNRFIVDRSTHVRAFYDFRGKGGTFNTINYSRSSGKSFDVWPLNRFDKNEIMAKSPGQFKEWFNQMKTHKVDLRAVKTLILQYILHVLGITVQAFIKALGYVGVKTLEAVWKQ